jgi:hypothetical protein
MPNDASCCTQRHEIGVAGPRAVFIAELTNETRLERLEGCEMTL